MRYKNKLCITIIIINITIHSNGCLYSSLCHKRSTLTKYFSRGVAAAYFRKYLLIICQTSHRSRSLRPWLCMVFCFLSLSNLINGSSVATKENDKSIQKQFVFEMTFCSDKSYRKSKFYSWALIFQDLTSSVNKSFVSRKHRQYYNLLNLHLKIGRTKQILYCNL